MNTIDNEILVNAAINSADTFCDYESNNLLNLPEREVWKECKNQFKKGASWQKEKDKAEYDKLKSDNEVLLNALKRAKKEIVSLTDSKKKDPYYPDYIDKAIKQVESK